MLGVGAENRKLIERIDRLYFSTVGPKALRPEKMSHDEILAELHGLAALIYLNRTALGYTGDEAKHKFIVQKSIQSLNEVGVCEIPWVLFVIGCEASEDVQRLSMCRIFEKTQRGRKRRSDQIDWIRQMVESFWKQVDLDETQKLSYDTIVIAVISSAPFLPAFA